MPRDDLKKMGTTMDSLINTAYKKGRREERAEIRKALVKLKRTAETRCMYWEAKRDSESHLPTTDRYYRYHQLAATHEQYATELDKVIEEIEDE